jgi:hypothetical protein
MIEASALGKAHPPPPAMPKHMKNDSSTHAILILILKLT